MARGVRQNGSMAAERLRTLITARDIKSRVEELGRKISADYPVRAEGPELRVIGVLNGAFVFLADLMRSIERDVSVDFLGVSSYGPSAATSGEVQIHKDLEHSIEGLDVLLVEDIVDTGLTLSFLCQVLRQRKPRSLKIVTLLDKPSRRIRPVELAYVGFEIPNEFVVGYGLDYGRRYRNLPAICTLEGISCGQ